MNKLLVAGGMLAIAATACKKTGDGGIEIQKPVVRTTTDTIYTPSADVRMDSIKAPVPKIQVKKDSVTVKVPKVEIKKP
jgi:hypothetical protein